MDLCELKAVDSRYRKLEPGRNLVVSAGGDYMVIPENKWQDPSVIAKVANLLDIPEISDLRNISFRALELINANSNAVVMFVEDGDVTLVYPRQDSVYTTKPSLDPNVKKLLDELGLKHEHDRTPELIDQEFYHGSTTSYIEQISKTGIRPGRTSNWEHISVSHKDIVFFTSVPSVAQFHARNATINALKKRIRGPFGTMPVPVIVSFHVPDENRVIPDFDTALLLRMISTNDEEYRNRFKSGLSINREDKAYRRWKRYGIYGYLGRIPPSVFSGYTLMLPSKGYLMLEDFDAAHDLIFQMPSDQFDQISFDSYSSLKEYLLENSGA